MISVPVGLLLRCFVNIGENEVDHEKIEKKIPTSTTPIKKQTKNLLQDQEKNVDWHEHMLQISVIIRELKGAARA